MERAATGGSTRIPGLDVLRLVAILLVIGRHQPDYSGTSPLVYRVLDTWHLGGWIGVDVFFVLSGFLIGTILLEELQKTGHIRLGRFYGRRGFKIYPAFYAFLAIYALLRMASGVRDLGTREWLSEVFFLQSYLPGVWIHTWSLAVEEHFYLALPLVLLALRLRPDEPRRNLMKVSLTGAVLAVACLAMRVAARVRHPEFDVYTHMFPSHLRIDSLFAGVVVACLWRNHREWFRRLEGREAVLLVLGTLLLVPAFILPMEHPLIDTIGFTTMALGSALIMIAILLWDSHRPIVRAIGWLGPYTYSIYLWHIVVLKPLPVLFPTAPQWLILGIYVVGSLGLGVLTARVIEMPVLALRERIIPRSSPPPGEVIEGSV